MIQTVSLEDISSSPAAKRFRRGESTALVSLFIKFKYVNTTPAQQQKHQAEDRHKYMLCPICREGQFCGKTGYVRNSGIADHICPLLGNCPVTTFGSSIVTHKNADDQPSGTARHRRLIPGVKPLIEQSVLQLISATPISFSLVASKQFRNFMESLISIGQTYSIYSPDSLVPYLDSHTFPPLILKKLEANITTLLMRLANKAVSLMCDAGKINHHHYLAFTIAEYSQEAPIFFFKLVSGPWTSEQYCSTLIKLLQQLTRWNITVATIITDGLAAQSAGIIALQQIIASRQAPNLEELTFIPLHIPCYNHRVNLALTDLFKHDSMLEGVRQTLLEFATDSDKAIYQTMLKKHCPSFIKTRWLSLWFICSFIRLKRHIICDAGWMPAENIIAIIKLEIILTPLMELHLFLETETTRFCYFFPALLRCFQQYIQLLNDPEFNSGEWLHSIRTVMFSLYNKTCTDPIIHLAQLAFAFTSIGRALIQRSITLAGFIPNEPLAASVAKLFVFYLSLICFLIL